MKVLTYEMEGIIKENTKNIKAEVRGQEEEFVEDKKGEAVLDEELIRERKEKIIKFVKTRYEWISYAVLAVIVLLAVKIRTRNLPGLRDITTGTWTLGPDLDPFFFLRMSKYIVEHGKIMAVDTMRYVPLGFKTSNEYLLHPYMMAWFHKYLGWTFGTESVTHSAVIYPVFMFALTVVVFFLLARIIFVDSLGKRNANIIALIASFFLTVMPPLLPRTIAGIPEKESAAFLFLFLAFYFFLASWKAKGIKSRIGLALLAGMATAGMANIWGGYIYIFSVIGLASFFAFVLGKMDKQGIYTYSVWILSSFILILTLSSKFTGKELLTSINTAPAVIVLFIVFVHLLIFKTNLKKYFKSEKLSKVPPQVISVIISVILIFILSGLFLGFSFIPGKINSIIETLIKPARSRLIQTVAENRQPYFTEWESNFGPSIKGIALTFWLFFVGSIYLFSKMINIFKKKERMILIFSYVIFLFSFIFSRYSPSSKLNGENFISLFVYAGGFLVLLFTFGYYYYRYHKLGELNKLKEIDFGFILLFMFFFMSILSARAAVRTIMVLVPSASIIISYFVVDIFNDAKKVKDETLKVILWIIVGIIILSVVFSGWSYYNIVNDYAKSYVPSVYTYQWQKAMAWVRENTPKDAVFGHWWDYGYWLQSIGERATVLDGGNAISYWNHLMGRYALTGTSNEEALEFLYAHNTTHFLIDSTDIGKYGAFSSIGSDVNYDRASFIPTFLRNNQLTQEKKNSTAYIYQGGIGLDEDIIYETNDSKIFLPKGAAGIAAIIVEKDSQNELVSAPVGIFIYQGKQYRLPLRYAFDNKLIDFGKGIESGIFLYPRAVSGSGGINIEEDGALLYLSKRTAKSQLARLYLYNEDNPYFKLVHTEDDFIISQIKSQRPDFDSEFIYYQGLRGPIKIWEISYPKDIEFKEEYLSTKYPEDILFA